MINDTVVDSRSSEIPARVYASDYGTLEAAVRVLYV